MNLEINGRKSHERPAYFWRLVDPRVKVLFTFIISGLALGSTGAAELLLVYFCIATIFFLSGTSVRTAWRGFRPFFFLLLLTALVQIFLTEGASLSPGVPVISAMTREGLAMAGLILLRLSAVILLSTLLVSTSSPFELSKSLGWALSPFSRTGLPVGDIMIIMNLGFQFFPLLAEEAQNVRMGLESRGVSLGHEKPVLRFKATAAWVLAVLTAVLEKSHRIAVALEIKDGGRSRAFRIRFPPWTSGSSLALFMLSVVLLLWLLAANLYS